MMSRISLWENTEQRGRWQRVVDGVERRIYAHGHDGHRPAPLGCAAQSLREGKNGFEGLSVASEASLPVGQRPQTTLQSRQ